MLSLNGIARCNSQIINIRSDVFIIISHVSHQISGSAKLRTNIILRKTWENLSCHPNRASFQIADRVGDLPNDAEMCHSSSPQILVRSPCTCSVFGDINYHKWGGPSTMPTHSHSVSNYMKSQIQLQPLAKVNKNRDYQGIATTIPCHLSFSISYMRTLIC